MLMLSGAALAALPAIFLYISHPRPVQFLAPGQQDIEIAAPGVCILWRDLKTVFQGREYSATNALSEVPETVLEHTASGAFVPMEPDASLTRRSGENLSQSIGRFGVPQAGKYQLRIQGVPPTVLSFTQDWLPRFRGNTLAFAAAGGIVFFLGAALRAWNAFKRKTPSKSAQLS